MDCTLCWSGGKRCAELNRQIGIAGHADPLALGEVRGLLDAYAQVSTSTLSALWQQWRQAQTAVHEIAFVVERTGAYVAGLFAGREKADQLSGPTRIAYISGKVAESGLGPLFMLAGELMVKAGMMERLVAFANSLVGRVHGGLAHVTIIAGTILASVSGAAVASASALSTACAKAPGSLGH